ncbi:glutathione S-transferase N-terminal domain-containing protein [Asticcacaulis sp. ZE23SCel15]|uniref:glutathione S-transferase family protein n=1 Tax=Asticcacaulis sp. ZE23SCel15 TaxID=3059027 RepID=UPI00265F4D65|nr:glutathione S-transferase N-terminal domain-containing protein [Asticcacaulis sp. ZE23SCel15]WKL57190.1 glutathione S-transferase N-terminal domain-containing protein [Asticcacaulis sp. ZE23SCel15]
MILIGQYDSPFVRRVGIALTLYGIGFEHKPWSTFRDGGKIAPYNPLRRVPVLVLDDGEALIDSPTMIDYLDEQAAAPLMARSGADRQKALYIMALATGLADKAVSLFYEQAFHPAPSDLWVERCQLQIADGLKVLEAERGKLTTPFWFGDQPGHADIAVACMLRFISEAHVGLLDLTACPALGAHHQACEALPVFQAIAQTFSPPGR